MAGDLTNIQAKSEAEDWQRRVERRQKQAEIDLAEFEKREGRIDLGAAVDGFLTGLDFDLPENFEEILIWAVIQYQEKHNVMKGIKLKIDDFLIYRKTWEEFQELYDRGEVINFMTRFKTISRSKLADLAKLYFGIGITPGQVPYYCKMIRKDWIDRQVKSFTDQTLVDEFYDKHKYEESMPVDPHEEMYDFFTEDDERREKIAKGYYGIETGHSWFDTGVCLDKGQLVTIAGRPGHGKSTLALDLALRCALNRQRVLFLNLEMSKGEVYRRALANTNLHEITLNSLQYGKVNKQMMAKLGEEFLKKYELLTIQNPRSCTTKTIMDIAHNYDVIVIDQLSCLRDDMRKNETKTQHYGRITRNLKTIVNDFNCAVLLCAQINRAGAHMPSLVNLKDSGSIEEDSDVVIFIQQEEEGKNTNVVLKCAKNRNGKAGHEAKFCFWKERSKFIELTK